jgi:hypothetical protein
LHIHSYKINYYNHSKVEGSYCGYNKEITIYITPEKRIIDVVNTLLHEYQHHIEMRTQKEVKQYFKVLYEIGYNNHPFEFAARHFAKQYRQTCFETFKENWF